MKYDSTEDTLEHINKVRAYLDLFALRLRQRGDLHDLSKLMEPEKSEFDRLTPRLKSLEYGSKKYTESLGELSKALEHHYYVNSHHPQHYKDGIAGMDLLDLVEMFFDWKASSERTKDGSMENSIKINADRFSMSPQLVSIFNNTKKNFFL